MKVGRPRSLVSFDGTQPLAGRHAYVRMRWCEPVDPNSKSISAAIAVIKPKDEPLCREYLANSIRMCRMLIPNDQPMPPKRILRELRSSTLKTARLLKKLSPSFRDSLLPFESSEIVEVEDDSGQFLIPVNANAVPPSARLLTELESLITSLNKFLVRKKPAPSQVT